MTQIQLLVILLTVFMSACAQLLLKLGMEKVEDSGGLLNNGACLYGFGYYQK